jgi:hypothetical protein
MQTATSLRFSDPVIQPGPFSPQEDDGIYEVCIANISPAERRKRLNFGIIQFVIGLVILAVFMLIGVDKVWRLTLVFPFGAAAAGFFQWRDKT